MIGQRLLRIGSLLLRAPLRSGVAMARAAQADRVEDAVLESWIAEEAEKRGVSLPRRSVSRILAMAKRAARTKRPGRLAVVCCHFNPANWSRPRDNYLRFLHSMEWHGVPVFNAEVAFPGQQFPTTDAFLQIHARDGQAIWQKERLINLLVEALPKDFTHIAWIDADILFLDRDWPSKTMAALAEYPVVQLWNHWHCCDEDGAVVQVLAGVGPMAERYMGAGVSSPGGAWAARRSIFPLYDKHIVGSGDAMCLEGWMGLEHSRCLGRMSEAMKRDYEPWAKTAWSKVGGNIGALKGEAFHLFHGTRQDRQYVDRWQPVINAGFDPVEHLRVADNGLLEWTDSAPDGLRAWVRRYFAARNEDGGQ